MEDAEAMAQAILREVHEDGADRPDVWTVAKRLRVSVFKAPRSAKWSELGERVRVNGEERVYLRADLTDPLRTVVLAHELGHVVVARHRLRLDDEERWCNRFGAALIAPEPAVWRTWQRAGRDHQGFLLQWNHTTPTLASLRLGECRCADVWIVERATVRYARAERAAPASLTAVAREAVSAGSARRPGVRAARLRDGFSRAAVLLEPDEAEAA